MNWGLGIEHEFFLSFNKLLTLKDISSRFDVEIDNKKNKNANHNHNHNRNHNRNQNGNRDGNRNGNRNGNRDGNRDGKRDGKRDMDKYLVLFPSNMKVYSKLLEFTNTKVYDSVYYLLGLSIDDVKSNVDYITYLDMKNQLRDVIKQMILLFLPFLVIVRGLPTDVGRELTKLNKEMFGKIVWYYFDGKRRSKSKKESKIKNKSDENGVFSSIGILL